MRRKEKSDRPTKSKSVEEYRDTKATTSWLPSAHSVKVVSKKTRPDKLFFLKDHSKEFIAELEAFSSFLYRIILLDQVPKIKAVHKQDKTSGVASRQLPGFFSFKELFTIDNCVLDMDALIDAGLGRILAACFFLEENDLHDGNIGFNDAGLLKIDHDQAIWPLVAKYMKFNESTYAFKITPDDIITFPIMKSTTPRNWVTQEKLKSRFDIDGIQSNEKFILDKYLTLLKCILIPPNLYSAIAEATISDPNMRELVVSHMTARTKNLENVLMSIPEFASIVVNNPDIIKTILNEFKAYNDDYSQKSKNEPLKIDLDMVHSKFDELTNRCETLLSADPNRKDKPIIVTEEKVTPDCFSEKQKILRKDTLAKIQASIGGLDYLKKDKYPEPLLEIDEVCQKHTDANSLIALLLIRKIAYEAIQRIENPSFTDRLFKSKVDEKLLDTYYKIIDIADNYFKENKMVTYGAIRGFKEKQSPTQTEFGLPGKD